MGGAGGDRGLGFVAYGPQLIACGLQADACGLRLSPLAGTPHGGRMAATRNPGGSGPRPHGREQVP